MRSIAKISAGNPEFIMKNTLNYSLTLLTGATLLFTGSIADARSYGVSSPQPGVNHLYQLAGGTAYAGPTGRRARSNGRTAGGHKNGAAYSGPNGAARRERMADMAPTTKTPRDFQGYRGTSSSAIELQHVSFNHCSSTNAVYNEANGFGRRA